MTPEQHDAIERDKEFWRTYADHTCKELLRSNGALTAKLIELGREVAEYEQSFDLYDDACRRGTAIWRDGHPERDLILPDTAKLVAWLLAALTDAQAENSVLREQIAEAWSAHGEVQKRVTEREELFRDACRTITDMETRDPDKRIAELEAAMADLNSYDAPAEVVTLRQQLAERDERILELEYQCKFNEGYFATLKELGLPERFLEEYQSQKMQIRELEQQLKSTQERLAEAEQLLRDVLETTPVDEHGHQLGVRDIKEHFAKYAPAIDPTAEIDPPELESDEPEVKPTGDEK